MTLSQQKPASTSQSISIDDLKIKLQEYSSKISLDHILKAYKYSKKAHEGQNRKSGEPYITHPLSVAGILVDLGMDQDSIITALLHDVVEDTPVSLKDVEKEFGSNIAFLLDGVTKISRMKFRNTYHKQSENIRKMIVAMGRDVRVILVKLADRLHNLRTLQYMPEDRQIAIANETLEVYAPLASRLGMNEIKVEMEDLSFKFAQPEEFTNLQKKMKEINNDKDIYTENVVRLLKKELQANGIWNCDVQGRYKNLYSIHCKMTYQYISFEEIHDIVAFRICVEEIHECYESLGLIHALWKPVPGRFKDFIAMPKRNNYQSLHTTVLGPEGRQIEIQIRTHDMHLIAERGVASHWIYKLGNNKTKTKGSSLSKFNWLQDLLSWHQNSDDSREFLENVKMDLFESEIYAFTPEGEIKEFPKGATPIDFAYAVHTQIGEKTSGAKVNGYQVPLDYKLKSGDRVEIITSKKPKPSKDWLKICVTSKARSRIRNFFKTEERKKSMEIGKKIFETGCRRFKINEKDLLLDPRCSEFMKSKGLNKKEDMFISLGFGKIVFKQVIEHLQKTENKEKSSVDHIDLQPVNQQQEDISGSPLVIEGADNVMVHFARCCYPVAGDNIRAYVSKKRGIVVHRNICKALAQISSDRFIEVNWKSDQSQNNDYIISLHIVCIDKPGTLSKLSEAFNFFDLNITNLKVNHVSSLRVVAIFDTKVKGLRQANQLIARLNQIDNVVSVKRKMDFD